MSDIIKNIRGETARSRQAWGLSMAQEMLFAHPDAGPLPVIKMKKVNLLAETKNEPDDGNLELCSRL